MSDAELARNYILNRLSEEEREECERRFLADPDFESLMLEQERDLLDGYAARRLPVDEASAVRRRAAASPAFLLRLRVAQGLQRAMVRAAHQAAGRATAQMGTEGMRRREPRLRTVFPITRRGMPQSVAAAGLLAACGILTVTLWRSQHPVSPATHAGLARAGSVSPAPVPASEAKDAATNPAKNPFLPGAGPVPGMPAGSPSAKHAAAAKSDAANATGREAAGAMTRDGSRHSATAATDTTATFLLLANQQRGEIEATTLRFNPAIATVRLQITTEDGLDPVPYTVAISAADGTKSFVSSHLTTSTRGSLRYVDLRLPAAQLPNGSYTLELTAETQNPAQAQTAFRFRLNVARADAAGMDTTK
jgi:hypothetical protein